MADLLGERLSSITRCIRTPTATAWRDGEFIDAALAMHLSSNLAHLQRESLRHIAAALGPGTITNGERGYTLSGTPFQDVRDPGTYAGVTSISWDARTARHFGPVLLLGDRTPADETPTWRQLRVNLDVSAANLGVFACLTTLGAVPDGSHLGFASTTSTAGRTTLALTLTPSRTLPLERVPSRRPDGSGPEFVDAAVVSLWVGWYGGSGTNSIYAITAHEVR